MDVASTIAGARSRQPTGLNKSPKEQVLDLRALVGKTVKRIERYRFGWRMRFTDGTAICVNEGSTFDSAGNFVREP